MTVCHRPYLRGKFQSRFNPVRFKLPNPNLHHALIRSLPRKSTCSFSSRGKTTGKSMRVPILKQGCYGRQLEQFQSFVIWLPNQFFLENLVYKVLRRHVFQEFGGRVFMLKCRHRKIRRQPRTPPPASAGLI